MKISVPIRGPQSASGFTMVEIAIAVAVIAFALVAIIGVLPAGLQVQKENREDTIIAQEGVYWMEAIRSGAEGLDELLDYVEPGSLSTNNGVKINGQYTAAQIIGTLSTPGLNSVVVRAISGSVADKGATGNDLAFKYKLEVEVLPYDPGSPSNQLASSVFLPNYLYELRLSLH